MQSKVARVCGPCTMFYHTSVHAVFSAVIDMYSICHVALGARIFTQDVSYGRLLAATLNVV